jgi:hypothetical protein
VFAVLESETKYKGVNIMKEKVEIPLNENAVYIVKNGKLTKVTAMAHGEDKIIWKNGQVLDFIRSERVRV